MQGGRKMKQKEQNEIKDKTYAELSGKILHESIRLEDLSTLSFAFESGKGTNVFRTEDKKVISKLCGLVGISYKKIVEDLREKGLDDLELFAKSQKFISDAVKEEGRVFVLLLDEKLELVSVVSEQHKQLGLSKAFEIVDKIAKKKKAVFIESRETPQGSYIVEYEVGRDSNMSVRVNAYLGRNDALGRAGISFGGGGSIFVCSNMIIPYVDKDVMVRGGGGLLSTKIVHTLKVEERLKNQLAKSFDYAKNNALVLSEALKKSQKIKMPRNVQEHCLELIRLKHLLPEKWNSEIKVRLQSESETLFGLSQALTWVGSHKTTIDSGIATKLQKLGGQVVLLGKDFTKLIEKSLQMRGIKVPVSTDTSYSFS
jgi:hypothetical protein